MNALHIARKDLQILIKDRGSLVQLFLLPLMFILVMSAALGGFESEDSLITLPTVNLDDGTQSQLLLEALDKAGGVKIEPYDDLTEAQDQLASFAISRLLIIPADLSANLAANRPTTLRLLNHPDASQTNTDSVQQIVQGVAQDLSLQNQLLASFAHMGDMLAGTPDKFQVFTPERAIAQAESQFERSKTRPLISIEQKGPASLSQKSQQPNSVQQNVPGYTIIFVFSAAGATAYSIYYEKSSGSFRRLLAAPMSKATLLAGKMIPNFAVALLQIAFIFAVSMFLLPMIGLDKLTLGSDPLALVIVSILIALCSTGMGILIAAFARTEGQIGGLSTLLLWTMGAVGGCLFPPFLLGGLLDVIGKAVPHYWAIQAYQDLIVRGRALSDVTHEMLALIGFTLVFFIVGLWRFDFD